MDQTINNQRLAWRLPEVSAATGLSLRLLRRDAKDGKLTTRKIGGAVITLHEDLMRYLKGEARAKN